MTTETALVVLVPEAEILVERFRNQYDPAAALGLPAHVTILYPFKNTPEITSEVVETLTELLGGFSRFDVFFNKTDCFPEVLYLAPDPPGPFRQLTEMVFAHFPENPPYGGEFPETVPHLTVAHAETSKQLRTIINEFAHAARTCLPIRSSIAEVVMVDNELGRWRIRHRFALSH
jgi:2'-5' RNA ligase